MNAISNENKLEIEKRYRTAMIIGLAQVVFVILIAAGAVVVVGRSAPSELSGDVTTLWVAILFLAIGSLILRRLFNGWERLQNEALLGGIPGVLKKLQKNSLILGMFAEAIAILGFVIAIYTGSLFDMIRATAIALVVFFITFPRKRVWRAVVANLQDK